MKEFPEEITFSDVIWVVIVVALLLGTVLGLNAFPTLLSILTFMCLALVVGTLIYSFKSTEWAKKAAGRLTKEKPSWWAMTVLCTLIVLILVLFAKSMYVTATAWIVTLFLGRVTRARLVFVREAIEDEDDAEVAY